GVIRVDGCFLKGPQGGHLLTAVGVDPNNAMYPIAYAIVENENKDSWVWFLSLLQYDLELDEEYAWTFMSDKQKGIPCKHTISAIWCRNEVPEDYVHGVYKVSTYLRCYEHAIQGVNGAELWPKCELPPPMLPNYENKPGRPKKMRQRQPDEPPAATNITRLKKCLKSLKCGKCGVIGHNARTCNKRSGQAKEMPIGTSQPPSTQESNHTQSTSLEPFNA
ncbi:UNVERIFIED_CONTAM: hypothetical protein Scaly_2517600, partial [Sesamum calycinum]